MKVPFLDLKTQYQSIKDEITPIVNEAMQQGMFIGGPTVIAFEQAFANFCDTKYAVGVNSGTDALRFALMAAGVNQGDEVITVSHTFIATAEAISQVGAQPVFVDIDPSTCNIDVSKIEAQINEKTKAIIPVHIYGQPADLDPLKNIADRYNLVLIEDSCQSHGALYKGRKAGSIGLAGCFSFYPGKNLGAFGEGGAVTTNDEQIAQKIMMIRDHGQSEKYYHKIEGYNGRLDAIQAGILNVKLKYLNEWNNSRRENAAYYDYLLSTIPEIDRVRVSEDTAPVYHLYVIFTEERDKLQSYLSKKGVATGMHYPLPLHLQEAYQHLGYKEGAFPVTEEKAKKLLSLPMYPELSKTQIKYVVDSIKEYFSE